jgi:hypothetical protein
MSNDTIIREVDEELRRDRLRSFWRHGGPWVIVAAVLVVVGVAGYEGWMWWSKTQAAKSSDQFYAAAEIADGTDVAAAKKALDDVIAQTSGGYPMLAQFREAALLSQNGKTDDAVAAYDALSTSLGDTHLRELALILGANLLIDKGDVAAVEQRVGGSITPADPLRNAAREVMGLTQYKAGKLDDAMKSFTDIMNDPLATQDLRNRIQLYTLQLLAEGAKPIAPPAPDQPSVSASSGPSTAPVSSEAPVASSSAVSSGSSSAVSSSAAASSALANSSEASAAVSSSVASAAVGESTELDVTPPVVLDDNLMSMAMPGVSSSAAEAPLSSSVAPVSSSVAPVSSEVPVSSSAAPLASSSAAPISSSAP